jgi:osmotically-inducible protein OsmY
MAYKLLVLYGIAFIGRGRPKRVRVGGPIVRRGDPGTNSPTREGSVNMEDRVVESVRGRLRSSAYSALKGIVCVGRGGAIELEGGVPSHYLKQVALALVMDVDGVTSVVNRIEVRIRRQH